jgi:hypothetical protein
MHTRANGHNKKKNPAVLLCCILPNRSTFSAGNGTASTADVRTTVVVMVLACGRARGSVSESGTRQRTAQHFESCKTINEDREDEDKEHEAGEKTVISNSQSKNPEMLTPPPTPVPPKINENSNPDIHRETCTSTITTNTAVSHSTSTLIVPPPPSTLSICVY